MIRFDGADLSHYQASIDWPTLRQASWWVATKATQGVAYVDPTMQAHRAQMGAQGFTHRGLYHWLSPGLDAAFQVDHFLATIGTLHPAEFVMLDAEEGGITLASVLAWCRAVEAVTRRPVAVYTGAYVAGGTIWRSPEVRASPYGPRPMHLAAYTTEAKALALPGVAANPWSAWQYSSSGPVPGVAGRCDMNRIDIVAHFDLAAGVNAQPLPQPEDSDMDVVTNAEAFDADNPALSVKFAVAYRGQSLYHLSGPEWVAGGSKPGVPMSNVDLDGLAAIPMPTMGGGVDQATLDRLARLETVTIQLNDAVGRVGQTVGGIQSGLVRAGTPT